VNVKKQSKSSGVVGKNTLHRAVSLRQRGFLVSSDCLLLYCHVCAMTGELVIISTGHVGSLLLLVTVSWL